jgi:hypothetical protein
MHPSRPRPQWWNDDPGLTDKDAVAGSSPESTRPTVVTAHRASDRGLLGRAPRSADGGPTEATHSLPSKGYADDVASSIEWLGDLVAALASDLSKHGPGVGVVCPDDWPFGSRHLGD